MKDFYSEPITQTTPLTWYYSYFPHFNQTILFLSSLNLYYILMHFKVSCKQQCPSSKCTSTSKLHFNYKAFHCPFGDVHFDLNLSNQASRRLRSIITCYFVDLSLSLSSDQHFWTKGHVGNETLPAGPAPIHREP